MIMKQEEFKQLKVGDKIRIKSEEELLKYYNIKDYLIFKVYDIKDIIFDKKEEEKMEEFKVGDRVQIKDWDEMVNEFGIDEYGYIKVHCSFFNTSIKHFCGEFATIKNFERIDKKVVLLDFENEKFKKDLPWEFSTDMIKLANEKTIKITYDNKVVKAEQDGKTGIAKCNEEDTFNLKTGIDIAVDRLLNSYPKMPKLENRMIVETRNGKIYMFVDNQLVREEEWLNLCGYNFSNGKNMYAEDYDIVKVYGKSPVLPTTNEGLTLLWQAPDFKGE